MSDIKTNNVLFTVPSTNNVNERITESELDNRVIDIATALSTIHGGATASDKKKGFWIGSNGNAVNEPVIEIFQIVQSNKLLILKSNSKH